jgi:glycerol-3-phosphate acyltransferase PlsY
MLQCTPLQTNNNTAAMLELGVKFLLSYFIGSVMGALLIGRLFGGVDIRQAGSGNAGGTNALRTQGWLFALGVVVIDIGKGAVGAGLVPAVNLPFVDDGAAVDYDWLVVSCAAAAVMGHVWPIWHDFRGGKGAATLVGTLAVMSPMLIAPVLIVWSLVLMLTGYVGLSTMCAGVSAPVWLAMTALPADQPLFIYCVAMALYLVFSHRSNIQRMRTGTENRMTRAMLFRRQS